MKTHYTSAPEAYDWFGTKTVDPCVGKYRGDNVRKVESHEDYYVSQMERYRSGLHFTVGEDEFEEFKFLLDK